MKVDLTTPGGDGEPGENDSIGADVSASAAPIATTRSSRARGAFQAEAAAATTRSAAAGATPSTGAGDDALTGARATIS